MRLDARISTPVVGEQSTAIAIAPSYREHPDTRHAVP